MLYLSGQYYYPFPSFNIKILIGIAVFLPEPAFWLLKGEHLRKAKGIKNLLSPTSPLFHCGITVRSKQLSLRVESSKGITWEL